MRIIALNGPPRSGKDTAAKLLGIPVFKFASILKRSAHAMYGLDVPVDFFEDRKDQRCPEFYGLTPRNIYIEVSERYFKPVHGNDFFGTVLAEALARSNHEAVAISDSGFDIELIPLIERFGENSITVVRLHRDGCSFRGDSRNYVKDRKSVV